jgi:hypothetical protein
LGGELRFDAGGIPILPSLDEATSFDTNDGSAGDANGPAGWFVAHIGRPVHADEVVFREDDDGSDVEIVELRMKVVVEDGELVRAAEGMRAVVENAVIVQEFGDGVAVAAVPDFFEPVDDELLVAFEERKGSTGGGHRILRKKVSPEYTTESGESLE